MATLNETPGASRIRIAFFGLRNAGKSTLVNAFTGQKTAIVSDVAGTTTDPVKKSMEILPLGPCLIIDTAGLDDTGELGALRRKKSLEVLATSDIAVWVHGEEDDKANDEWPHFLAECARRNVQVVEYRRGEDVEALKRKIAAISVADEPRPLLDGLVKPGDRVVCVCPIDESAPKGRLILPQVQLMRECLDTGAVVTAVQPKDLGLVQLEDALVVTDSQAFAEVRAFIRGARAQGRAGNVRLTSFSVLFARQKGDLAEYARGMDSIASLKDGDVVLVAEGCTHHRQCNDIGTVKIPKALAKLSGARLDFRFASGASFDPAGAKLVVQCGGCMLTRREMMRRIRIARDSAIPIANYGLVLAAAGMKLRQDSAEVEI